MTNLYDAAFEKSIKDPNGFWGEAGESVHWYKKWDKVLDDSNKPFYRWFTGGEINTCYNALDYHVDQGRGSQAALIYDSPVTDTIKTFTYSQLRDEVAKFAGVLAAQGVAKGDRVLIYMPMVPEAVIAMLAWARIGAVHSVVFGGFAANELAVRIDDAKPKVIVSASCGIEVKRVIPYKPLLDKAIETGRPANRKSCIILQRPQEKAEMTAGRDLDWNEVTAAAEPHDCVPVAATDPLYILYTSGTTGVAERRGARQRRTRRGPQVDHEEHLQHRRRRRLLGRLRRRLGRGPLLHRLRSPVQRVHDDPLRRQTGRHTRCRRFLARHFPAQGQSPCSRPRRPSGPSSSRTRTAN